jgi:hypothetical protein
LIADSTKAVLFLAFILLVRAWLAVMVVIGRNPKLPILWMLAAAIMAQRRT